MGQISYPILNRFGYSMYWNNMWDNTVNFNKFFLKTFFLNNVIFNFFNLYLTLNLFFLTNHFVKNLKRIRKYNFFKTRFLDFPLILRPNKFYQKHISSCLNGRIRIYIYSGWFILLTNIHSLDIGEPLEDYAEKKSRKNFILRTPKLIDYLNNHLFYKNNISKFKFFKNFKFEYL